MTIDRISDTRAPNPSLLGEGRRWGFVAAVAAGALDAEVAIHEAARALIAEPSAARARAFASVEGAAVFANDIAEYGEDVAVQYVIDHARRVIESPYCPEGAPCAILGDDGAPVPGTHRGAAQTAGGRRLFVRRRADGRVDIWADVPSARPHGLTEWHDGRLSLTGAFALVEVSRGWVDSLNAHRGFAFGVTVVDGAGNPAPAARLAHDANLRSALRAAGLDPDRGPVWEVYEH